MTPDMALTWTQAWTHVTTTFLRGLPADAVTTILALPAIVEDRAHIERLALTEDVQAMRAACQTWAKALRLAVATGHPGRCTHPGTIVPWGHTWVTEGTGTWCLRCEVRQDALPVVTTPAVPRKRNAGKKGLTPY